MSQSKCFILEDRETGTEIAVLTVTAEFIRRCFGEPEGSLVFESNEKEFLLNIPSSKRLREVGK